LTLKAKINDWDQYLDFTNKILYDHPDNLAALQAQAFYTFVRLGDMELGMERLELLISTMAKLETKNTNMMFRVSQLFARICGRHPGVLGLTLKLLASCKKYNPINAVFFIEQGVQLQITGEFEKAY